MPSSKGDQKAILTLLDVAGSCIVDVFYNHMYDRAIAVHEKTRRGLTECYRQAVTEYISESNSSRFYTMLLNSIHHYMRMSTIYNEISYSGCVTLLSSLFVPHMYVNSLTTDQRVDIVSLVLGNTIRLFGQEVLQQHISCIIDDHSDHINIEILQDSILKILLNERNVSYERFIHSQKTNQGEVVDRPTKSAKETPKVANKAMVKLADAFKKSVSERAALKKKNVALTKKNKALVKQFEELKQLCLNQFSTQKEQSKMIAELQEQLSAQADVKPSSQPAVGSIDDEDDDELFSVQYVEA